MPTCGHVYTVYVRGCMPVHASLWLCKCKHTLRSFLPQHVLQTQGSRFLPSTFAHLGGKIGGHAVPRFCNSDLVSLQQHVFFSTRGKSDSQARITRSGKLLIKRWERLGIPWEADNGGSGVFLWYPEQQALGNQVQLNSPPHTHHYLTNIWQEKYLSWLKAVRFCDVCFCWWHVSFPLLWACMDMLTFPLCELACVCCVCMSPVWLAAVSFRCPSSSCSLIRAGAPAVAGRKLCSRKCRPDTVLLATVPIGHLFIWGKGKPPFPSSVIPKSSYCRILSWIGGVVFCVFVLSSVIDILLMGVTEIHTGYSPWLNTPAYNFLRNVLFFKQVKLELHLKCTVGHRALTQALSDDVILRKPPLGQQKGKWEL